jgi:hypothetical protein
MAKGIANIVTRLRAGETLYSWDVHHTSLRHAIRKGLVECGDTDCRIRLTDQNAQAA